MEIKKSLKIIFVAASMASGSAMAQGAPDPAQAGGLPPGGGPHMTVHGEQMQKAHAQHMQELRMALKLRAEQEGAWKVFDESMQPPARPAGPPPAIDRSLSTPERLDRMEEFHQRMAAEMHKRRDAIKSFYVQLDAGQQKAFDQEFDRHMRELAPAGPKRAARPPRPVE